MIRPRSSSPSKRSNREMASCEWSLSALDIEGVDGEEKFGKDRGAGEFGEKVNRGAGLAEESRCVCVCVCFDNTY